MTIGFRINTEVARASDELMNRFNYIPTAHISDSMQRLHAAGAVLRPMHRSGKLIGNAVTVKVRPGDNLMVHKAIDTAQPRDVIVVDAGGDLSQAIIGELMMRHAQRRGIAGLVINGAVRDMGTISNDIYPVYAAGITHRGPYKDGPGEINFPVSIGGMVIHPGDIIVGDEDGVVAIPLADAEAVLALTETLRLREEKVMREILDGTVDRSWVDAALKAKGFKG